MKSCINCEKLRYCQMLVDENLQSAKMECPKDKGKTVLQKINDYRKQTTLVDFCEVEK